MLLSKSLELLPASPQRFHLPMLQLLLQGNYPKSINKVTLLYDISFIAFFGATITPFNFLIFQKQVLR